MNARCQIARRPRRWTRWQLVYCHWWWWCSVPRLRKRGRSPTCSRCCGRGHRLPRPQSEAASVTASCLTAAAAAAPTPLLSPSSISAVVVTPSCHIAACCRRRSTSIRCSRSGRSTVRDRSDLSSLIRAAAPDACFGKKSRSEEVRYGTAGKVKCRSPQKVNSKTVDATYHMQLTRGNRFTRNLMRGTISPFLYVIPPPGKKMYPYTVQYPIQYGPAPTRPAFLCWMSVRTRRIHSAGSYSRGTIRFWIPARPCVSKIIHLPNGVGACTARRLLLQRTRERRNSCFADDD